MIVSQKQLPPPGEHHESGGGDEGLTRDFLDHRALSHSDILNIASL
jgi:hypothetical protein